MYTNTVSRSDNPPRTPQVAQIIHMRPPRSSTMFTFQSGVALCGYAWLHFSARPHLFYSIARPPSLIELSCPLTR